MGAVPPDGVPESIDKSDIIFYIVMVAVFTIAILTSKHQEKMNDSYDFTYIHQGSVISLHHKPVTPVPGAI